MTSGSVPRGPRCDAPAISVSAAALSTAARAHRRSCTHHSFQMHGNLIAGDTQCSAPHSGPPPGCSQHPEDWHTRHQMPQRMTPCSLPG